MININFSTENLSKNFKNLFVKKLSYCETSKLKELYDAFTRSKIELFLREIFSKNSYLNGRLFDKAGTLYDYLNNESFLFRNNKLEIALNEFRQSLSILLNQISLYYYQDRPMESSQEKAEELNLLRTDTLKSFNKLYKIVLKYL